MKCKILLARNANKLEETVNDWLKNNSKIQLKHVAMTAYSGLEVIVFYEE
jgi:hypothetical protein